MVAIVAVVIVVVVVVFVMGVVVVVIFVVGWWWWYFCYSPLFSHLSLHFGRLCGRRRPLTLGRARFGGGCWGLQAGTRHAALA